MQEQERMHKGYAVVCRSNGADIYVLIQKATHPPARKPLWFFPGGPLGQAGDEGQNYAVGVTRLLTSVSGAGTPAGVPPLEPVSSIPLKNRHNPSKNRIFHVVYMAAGCGGGQWDAWDPCPAAEHMSRFEIPDAPLSLSSNPFVVRNGHCWARWADLHQECAEWDHRSQAGKILNNELVAWFQKNGDRQLERLQKHLTSKSMPGSMPGAQQQHQKPRKACKYFAQGRCNKGDSCPFSHDTSQCPEVPMNGMGGQGGGESRAVCRNMLQYGNCKFGNKCKFLHTTGGAAGGSGAMGAPAPVAAPPQQSFQASAPVVIPLGGAAPATAPAQANNNIKQVANDFLGYFYSTMSSNPSELLPLYMPNATWAHEKRQVEGSAAIGAVLQQDAARLTQLAVARGRFADSAESMSGSILVQAVCATQSMPARSFAHVFLLVNAGGSWKIQNENMQYM